MNMRAKFDRNTPGFRNRFTVLSGQRFCGSFWPARGFSQPSGSKRNMRMLPVRTCSPLSKNLRDSFQQDWLNARTDVIFLVSYALSVQKTNATTDMRLPADSAASPRDF